MIKAIATAIALTLPTFNFAQTPASDDFAGFWDIHSADGYHGHLALDGFGGCSYFITSAFITVQATCVVRPLSDGTLMIFGTQEGTAITAPAYGEQLTVPSRTQPPTTLNILIQDITHHTMHGMIIAAGRRETATFSKQ